MGKSTSNLWLGLGVGAVIGAFAYRFSRTPKGRKLKKQACETFHKIGGQTEEMLTAAKEKVLKTGATVANKVAEKTSDIAEKADEFKSKAQAFAAAEAKK